ncbi:MAG: VOC family protein [Asgard group archaeon]|nr:VOC family protein [Asgard group archaeon]
MTNFSSLITFFKTDDLEKTTTFYTEILNCRLIVDQGDCRIFESSKGSYFGFCVTEFLKKEDNAACLTFVCDSKKEVDYWHQKLVKYEVEIRKPPLENSKYKIYNLFAIDPNNVLFEIQYFLHPFPPMDE